RPRSTPAPASRSAKRLATGRLSPNSATADSGGATRRSAPEVICHHLGLLVDSPTDRRHGGSIRWKRDRPGTADRAMRRGTCEAPPTILSVRGLRLFHVKHRAPPPRPRRLPCRPRPQPSEG